ncbi:MAG: ATP-dependent DNA helicase [Ginsengibacter sp.]
MLTHREKLLKKFNDKYQKLNKKQQQAVDTIEGPVMVIAGPGTGKTQILAVRIDKILLETDALPQNILCLTYTEAGAIAMRRRLLQFIGPDSYKVNVYTFHGFCNDIIQENLYLFEKISLNPVSDLERIRLYKTLIDNLPKGNLLKRYRGDVYFEINNLQHLFSTMKREGWEPQYLLACIDEYLEKIKDDDHFTYKNSREGNYEKGDHKPAYGLEINKMEKLRAAVKEFDNFQSLMKKNSLYDFDDMINWVIKAFSENKDLLSHYQEKFKYILVDEYQDTSGVQNEIVKQLISFWDSPNIFIVGDDDQSIFRFQGANMENMENFANSYKNLLKVVLVNNYRSTQPILDVSKSLIDKNTERLIHKQEGLNKDLISSDEKIKHFADIPLIVEYRTVKDEMADVVNKVQSLIGKGVEPGAIALIYKENRYGDQLMKYFEMENIPVYSKRNINILEDPFAKKILKIGRYLAAEHDAPYGGDELLFEMLHFDFYKIPPIEIAKITVEVNSRKYGKAPTSIRKLLYEKAHAVSRDLFDTGLLSSLKDFSKMMEQLIADVSNVTLQQLFVKIISDAGVLSYIMKSDDKIRLLQIVTALFDFVKEETAANPSLNLEELVSVIESMEKEKIPLPWVQVSGSEKGVNLLTAHGSKGLEFEHVFITGLNAYLWEKKKKPSNGYPLPNTLFSSLPSGNAEEELRRLLYVALTRAKKNLQISFIKIKPNGREAEASMFIAEITEANDLRIQHIALPAEELMKYEVLNYRKQAPEITSFERSFIEPLLEKYVMNVTSLNNYLDCPLAFYYKNLVKIPSGKSESLEFGSAVHFALQRLFEEMQKDANQDFPSKETMFGYFKWYMNHHRENFTQEAFDRRMEYGEKVLTDYYENYIGHCNKIVVVERNIKNVTINGIPVKGKIDKMEFTGKEVNVVDYKTGNVNSEYTKKKLSPPDDQQPNGGDYWRQAVFYKMLVDNMDSKDWKVVSTEFDFVEPDKAKGYQKRKIFIAPEDMETVKQQLTTVWNKIQSHDFYTGCGKEDCHWCQFVKDNQLAVALHNIMEEAEEEMI